MNVADCFKGGDSSGKLKGILEVHHSCVRTAEALLRNIEKSHLYIYTPMSHRIMDRRWCTEWDQQKRTVKEYEERIWSPNTGMDRRSGPVNEDWNGENKWNG